MSEDSLLDGVEVSNDDTSQANRGENTNESSNDTKYDFVLDRYRAEGKTEIEAALEQAKGYNEIRTKLGAFTGAPDEYEVKLNDELVDAGVELDTESPLYKGFMEMAKEMNMSQDGLNKLINLYSEDKLAQSKAIEDVKAEEMKALGNNAQSRLAGINKYINANFDEQTVEALKGMVTTADSVMALEAVISKMQGAPMADTNTVTAPSITAEELREMQFATNEHGQRKINTDPDFKRRYEEGMKALYGDTEYRQMIG